MFALSQSINGISLNGQEFALDNSDNILQFDSITDTKNFAVSYGANIIDFENGVLNVCEILSNGSYEVVS